MGAVVVGVDGSEHSRRALGWALREARLRGCPLHVVYAWTYPVHVWPGYVLPYDSTVPARIQHESEELVATLVAAESTAGEPPVEIRTVVVEGKPAERLLEASAGADLLVVGSRGHGGFAGLLLGSVGQQCAHHARCPVAIVPPARTD